MVGAWLVCGAAVLALAACPVWAAERPTAKKSGPFTYDPKGHRDPFVPLVRDGRLVSATQKTRTESSKPTLYGILWDPGGQSIALINDGEVKVGDTIRGYKVMEIRRDAVVLNKGGEPVVLEIAYEAPPVASSRGTTTGGEGP